MHIHVRIGNHMNSSAIWEIVALSHALEGSVISRGKAEWKFFLQMHDEWNYFPKLHENSCD